MLDVKPRILCVDDDPDILDGFKQNLRRHFNLHLASNAEEALQKLQEKPFEVILSDMRMPGMNGATFLQKSRNHSPDAVRLLLTGQCDVESAISAVNDGKIFRFLTKPCGSKELHEILNAAVHQHRLVTAEKELLQKTLKGSIKVLTDALAMTSPLAFGRARRIHKRVTSVCQAMEIKDSWHIEIASMLSQLGAIAVNDETLEKLFNGSELTDKDKEALKQMPVLTRQLLANIPRLDKVISILDEMHACKPSEKKSMSLPAQILNFALDIDDLEIRGSSTLLAISSISNRANTYAPELVEVFNKCFCSEAPLEKIKEIPVAALQEGMIVADNIYTASGALLVTRGFEISAGFAAKARGFKKGFLREPLRVIIPEEDHVTES